MPNACAHQHPHLPMPIIRKLSATFAITIAALLAGCGTPAPKLTAQAGSAVPAKPTEVLRKVPFAALPGWGTDDLREAWPAFLSSCDILAQKSDWREPCAAARKENATDLAAIRAFFEYHFSPHQVLNPDGSDTGLMTGYYEPLLRGARKRGGPYQTPLYRKPHDLLTIDLASVYPEFKGMRLRGHLVGNKVLPYPSRAEISQSNILAGKELLWVDDPIEAFFLQVQGSGRVQLADTRETVRVAYADQNGYPYKSIGRYLADMGEISLDQASAQGIKAWFVAHPTRQQELLNANPSFVFFKEEAIKNSKLGPKGALGAPLTARRSIAVDPIYVTMGTPVFISTTHPTSNKPLQSLVMAQDTGSAIKGAIRIDYFWGFGAEAGENAGKTKQPTSVWLLLPKHAN